MTLADDPVLALVCAFVACVCAFLLGIAFVGTVVEDEMRQLKDRVQHLEMQLRLQRDHSEFLKSSNERLREMLVKR